MEIDYGFLARAAEVAPDGTLSVLGAGFDTIRATAFPAPHLICVVVRLKGVETGESEMHVEFDILDPAGKSILDAPINQRLVPQKLSKKIAAASTDTANILLHLGSVMIPVVGEHQMRLRVTKGTVVEKIFRLNAEVING
jgi:hypothetical protein